MIVFKNKGLIPLEAIDTMGISVKEHDSPIGMFGTGLKYALAVLLREGYEVLIYRGYERLVFGTETLTVRGKEFQAVTMNGRRLPFTTEYGKNWQPWQAFRELWSNSKDELGIAMWADGDVGGEAEHTVITVSGPEAKMLWEKRSEVLLMTNSVGTIQDIDVHPGSADFIYYKGIRAGEWPKQTLFTYNILSDMELSEDRNIAHSHNATYLLAKCIMASEDAEFLEQVMTADGYMETAFSNIDFVGYTVSDTMMGVCLSLKDRKMLKGCWLELFKNKASAMASYASTLKEKPNPLQQGIIDKAVKIVSRKYSGVKQFNVCLYNMPYNSGITFEEDGLRIPTAMLARLSAEELAVEMLLGVCTAAAIKTKDNGTSGIILARAILFGTRTIPVMDLAPANLAEAVSDYDDPF